jgi:ADP-ribose pyrophosphatase
MSPSDTPRKPSAVDVLKRETVYDGYFRIDRYTFRHESFSGGTVGPFSREVFERGHAVAVLPYDPVTDTVVLIEQFRVGAFVARADANLDSDADAWLMEVVAGIIDPGETPEQVGVRECKEEAGLDVLEIEKVMTYLASPGGTTESVHLYVARVDASNAGGVHGLDAEHEDIRVHAVAAEQAFAWAEDGRLHNATFVLAMQWLKLNRAALRERWGADK